MAAIGFQSEPSRTTYRPPRECPVCANLLSVTRLGCPGCGSELSGLFAACSFCGLAENERQLLAVFLSSRGNMRRVEKHLGVSYPTARQRFADLLAKLGIAEDTSEPTDPASAGDVSADRDAVLARLASGEITVDEAERLLRASG